MDSVLLNKGEIWFWTVFLFIAWPILVLAFSWALEKKPRTFLNRNNRQEYKVFYFLFSIIIVGILLFLVYTSLFLALFDKPTLDLEASSFFDTFMGFMATITIAAVGWLFLIHSNKK